MNHQCDVSFASFLYFPDKALFAISELRPFRLVVEFSLVKPSGGLHYVLPKLGGRLAERNVHMFTCGKESNSRLVHFLVVDLCL